MAVDPKRIKERLRAKYPKANLSATRLDELSAKLSQKPQDDAEDSAIDEILDDYNDLVSFEGIARNDDKIRQLESRKPVETPPAQPKEEGDKTEMQKMMELMTAMQATITGMQEEKKHQTLSDRFNSDERVKNIPNEIRSKFVPTNEDDFDSAADQLATVWSGIAKQTKADEYGKDGVPGGTKQPKPGEVKQWSKEHAAKIAKSYNTN